MKKLSLLVVVFLLVIAFQSCTNDNVVEEAVVAEQELNERFAEEGGKDEEPDPDDR